MYFRIGSSADKQTADMFVDVGFRPEHRGVFFYDDLDFDLKKMVLINFE